ncbi:ABC transporter ATP-binding protein [Burkholderia ubonensis]|uniref:ABC transporter ATP-binding protein n=1 Tax=Burkholderia ubonensis TaxID=101571 RepID=UPI00075498B2|nr:ABC transporter ATP-binding protein [Burkholderia ubonensis]KWK94600.1 ABC transporter ATP-binding protein [Burkholderia ubonensis]KWN00132.1 ABC transporter ATP-binding protein [Burkholderia ubonensis]KWN40119.1 ABC transporter ATP-binding protein [Burkholderia ubonensis]ODQ32228.1 ABC transporter ATP-binding protein [Burkholderia ubonensis]
MSLDFEHVSFQYPGARHGVDDVTLSAAQGELLAVMGRSGSGKSTLLRLAAGLLDGWRGRIAIGGDDVAGVPVWQREVGMVFQHYALFPNLSVVDNVAYGLRMRGVAADARRRRALEMLERVGLSAHADRGIAMLSGGQQQRVALARALVIEPKLLLLDEPLAALDAGIRHQLRDEIRALQRACGATTLLVTHDQDEALSMADRVAIVDGGRMLQAGTPRDLYERPASAQVARFVGHSTVLRGRVLAQGAVDVRFTTLCAETGAHRPGDTVDVLVRPEHVQPDPPAYAVNRIDGRIGEVRYFGATQRFDFVPAGGTDALLCEGRELPARCIAIEPRHLLVLPAA